MSASVDTRLFIPNTFTFMEEGEGGGKEGCGGQVPKACSFFVVVAVLASG